MNENQDILTKIKKYRIPYKELNNFLATEFIPMWKVDYNNNLAEINEMVARQLLYKISNDLFGGVNEIEFKNEEKNPTNHFQMVMYLDDYILWSSPFIYVDNKHKLISSKSKIMILNSDYDDIAELKENNVLKGGKADKIRNINDLYKYWAKKGYENGGISKSLKKELESEIALGKQIEGEHTNSPEKILEIVFDHLVEDKNYYTKAKPKNWAEKEIKKEVNETKQLIKVLIKQKLLIESNIIKEDDRREYLNWKRKNVTLRGVSNTPDENGYNGAGAAFGNGLYTAFLSNKSLAKGYGTVYFVVNAIPKHPKVVDNWNNAEIFVQNVVNNWCKKNDLTFNPDAFYKQTNLKDEMIRLGYDGLIIKGREMVNYIPPDNVIYFKDEHQLYNYYNFLNNK